MNICSYRPLVIPDTKSVNERFKELYQQVCFLSSLTSQGVYATNAAAITGGLRVGQYYITSTGEVRIVV